ncbi:LANO_0G02828g1_1 [Lachancea nothofagi CBS 11611]|uniref:DNA repair protein RAD50 n=1 Tax=Lachancea nothofagi CBS 11611 TaxID=1266666 RepID=A0A1G4KFE8_9SACH|nr:LANO_0G02828g1_1 [Lachancea nothofagi CBS 11611]
MSAIYKLSIQGIRSFDSNERETIEFGKPLTLIVGTNGSGKTTIIECLKYATTGDLPPNSKGGAFVHDPKITGEKDVRAQVKLAFTSANDVNMIVTRNIQLLVKKTTNTFKTLEGQLVAVNKGERTTLSSRAAELDSQVPLYMGVPKAILDYVVFCHQEDSLWPLSEPSTLKKRFDEIFQAMKFTKALDNLKVIKKDMSIDIKLLKQSVEHLKVDRDRSRSSKINISTLEKRIEEYTAQVRHVDQELNEITQQSDKLFKSNQEFQQVLSMMDGLKHNRNSLAEQIGRIESTTEPLDLPRGKLESLVANFSSALEEKQIHVQHLQDQIQQSGEKLDDARKTYNALISRQGGLKAREETCGIHKNEFTSLTEKLRREYAIQGENVASRLGTHLETCTDKLNALCLQNRKEQDGIRKAFSELENSRIKQEQHLIYSKNDKEKLLGELDSLRLKLGEMSDAEEELKKEKETIKGYEARLSGHDGESEISAITSQIKEKNAKVLILEDDLEKNHRELLKVNEQADLNAKYTLLRKTLDKKTGELEKSYSYLSNDEKAKLWKLIANSDLELEFKRLYVNLQKELAGITREHNNISKSMAEKVFIQEKSNAELEQNEKKLISLQSKIKNGLPEDSSVDDYAELLQEAEESYRVAVENLKMYKTTLEFNLKALEVAKSNNCCYLCQRKFHDGEEQSYLLEELQSRTNTQYEETLKDVLQEEKEYLGSLRKLESDFIMMKSLADSKQVLERQINDVFININTETVTMKASEVRLETVKAELDHVENVIRPLVEGICRLRKEVKSLDKEFQDVSDEISVTNGLGDSFKTAEELQTIQKQLSNSLREWRRELGELQEKKETKSKELTNLLGLIREKKYKIYEFEKQLNEKEHVASSIREHEDSIDQVESIIASVSFSLEKLSNEIDALKRDLSSREDQATSLEMSEKRKLDALRDKRESLMRLLTDIQEFETIYASQLKDSEKDISLCNEQITILVEETASLNKDLILQKQKINDSSNELKNLKLNIDMIDLRSELEKVETELKILNIQNAEAQRDKYQQESARLRSLFEKLSSDNAGRMGEIKQLQNQVQSLVAQLKSDYDDVDNIYQKEWVKLQTKTIVTDDIEIYSKALDSAIMKYHSLKMQDINRIIDELWKRTYSGTDVDTIKIKSDEVSTTTRGKSYNYRVVMYKQDAELDMRGRCSAGQKVLASIMIRLALSETFGVNCGVIALDEPTTNLDEENIESLARSLNNIIEFRRHQKNFQLIVITHDEKFLRYMNAAEFADHFYKVKRDDRQKSQIEWVNINKVIS